MSARRCSTCNINWPTTVQYNNCPECDSTTWYSPNNDPDDRSHLVAERAAAQAGPTPAHEHRVERYLSLGFSEVDAQVLACAVRLVNDSKGRVWTHPLNWLDVKAVLDQGCTHVEAVAIYA